MAILKPVDAAQLAEMAAAAAASGRKLEIAGGGSKRALGRATEIEDTLDVSGLDGVVDYEPSELVITARAGTKLDEVEKLLRDHNQMLAFEPPDWRGLLGAAGQPTLGGTLACNMAGPRRIRAGAARDHFLGFTAVNGRGEIWKAGGRVVKNVTGYDMCKLQAGAYGTLSALTEVSLKVLPRPETSCSVLLTSLDDEAAFAAMTQALNSPHEVSAAAHLPAVSAGRAGLAGAATLLRLEGPAPSVAYRAQAVAAMFAGADQIGAAASEAIWSLVADARALLEPKNIIWRICATPSLAAGILRQVQSVIGLADGFYDWGGGLLWVSVAADLADGGAAAIRAVVAPTGGTAMLLAAPASMRARVNVFGPMPAPLLALTRRVKTAFDPLHVLNPGRMQEGI